MAKGTERKNYADTLNLPRTSFSMKANLKGLEPELVRSWQEAGIYKELRRLRAGCPPFILHDGPPYANEDIHLGTALNKTLKDIVVKHRSACGKDARYIPGWDCHGLPIEHQVARRQGKKDGEASPIEARRLCAAHAHKFVDLQRQRFMRLGVLGEWDKPYLTMDPSYEAAELGLFRELVEKGFVYRGLRPIHWCPSCRTALAEAEIEYGEHTSPSITVLFRVASGLPLDAGELPASLLVWTTTPWTLVANMAVALHPQKSYAAVRVDSMGEVLVMLEQLVSGTMETLGIAGYEVVGTCPGRKFEDVRCEHPFAGRESRVVLGEHVTSEEGTGCVHTAPGHGREDFEIGRQYGLPVLVPVDDRGRFTSEAGELAGEDVFAANEKVVSMLRDRGRLARADSITHSYPHCWRCRHPLVVRATKQWFVSIDKNGLRQKALEEIDRVQWVPDWGKGRISAMVASRPDWCLSRQRVWGVPVPVFYCESCEAELATSESIRAVEELVGREGSDGWFLRDASEILPAGTRCGKCGEGKFRKESDILDVWFDSGASHRAVIAREEGMSVPVDLYLEGSDQHRGWFQTSLLTAVAASGQAPYRTVLTHGFVVDGEGKKMSKKLGNVIWASEAMERYGADILRLWVASEDYRQDIRISDEILKRTVEIYRRMRNTSRFILGNICDFEPERDRVDDAGLLGVDRWARARLGSLVERAGAGYEAFDFHRVVRELHNFCTVDMGSFYLDVAKDRLYTLAPDSRERRSAQTVMLEIMETVVRVMAPILCFTAEEIWRQLPGGGGRLESVHLELWPEVRAAELEPECKAQWDEFFAIRTLVNKALEEARGEGVIGNSLGAAVELTVPDETRRRMLEAFAGELAGLLLVSRVTIQPAVAGEGSPGAACVRVSPASGSKCARCWRYEESVGESSDEPELCSRCVEVTGGGRGPRS